MSRGVDIKGIGGLTLNILNRLRSCFDSKTVSTMSNRDSDVDEESISVTPDEIEEMMEDIQYLQKQINETKVEIQEKTNSCVQIRSYITHIANAVQLLPECHQDVVISEEHEALLRQRRQELDKRYVENDAKRREIDDLEAEYHSLMKEEVAIQKRISDYHKVINEHQIDSTRYKIRHDFYDRQIEEMRKELRVFREMKQKAVRLIRKLESKDITEYNTKIREKRTQLIVKLQKLEDDYNGTVKRTNLVSDRINDDKTKRKELKAQQKESGNWKADRANLTQQLEDLKEQVFEARKSLSEQSRNSRTEDPIFNQETFEKWKFLVKAHPDAPVYDGNPNDLIPVVEEPRTRLLKILEENTRLSSEVEQLRTAIDREIVTFRERERKINRGTKDSTTAFAEEEAKLLHKIKAMKIKIAQAKLKQ